MEKQKVLLLFSGGYDSVILLHDLLDQGFDVHVMYIDYGQKVAPRELIHFDYWVAKHKLTFVDLILNSFDWTKSTITGGKSTGNESKDEYVEMRNLIFLGYASSYAQAKGINAIYCAFVHGEHYDDTNPLFVKAFDLLTSTTIGIEFRAPYVNMTKGDITSQMENHFPLDLNEVFEHSITCNTPKMEGRKVVEPCGKCNGCKVISELKENFLK